VLEEAESSVRGSKELARVAFAGALIGIAGMTMAFVTIANASAPGANAEPVVSKAVTTGAAGPFLVGAAGFSAFLLATGVLTLRTGRESVEQKASCGLARVGKGVRYSARERNEGAGCR
jgi:hypothetical protein